MDGPVPRWRNPKRPAAAESRRRIGLCLRQAFPVGDEGSFTSLLQAIGEDTGKATC